MTTQQRFFSVIGDELTDVLDDYRELSDAFDTQQKQFINHMNSQISALDSAAAGLLDELHFQEAIDALNKAADVLEPLDVRDVLDGDLSSLVDTVPNILRAFEFDEAANTVEQATTSIRAMDMDAILSGDLDTLVQNAPDLLRAFHFEEAAALIDQTSVALQTLNINELFAGDLTSLLDATPEFLRAFEFDEAAESVEQARGAIEGIDVGAVLQADLDTLVGAAPALLDAFGFEKAAEIMSKAESGLKALNVDEILAGNLRSITEAVPELLRGFGLDNYAEMFEGGQAIYDEFLADIDVDDDKKRKRNKASAKRAKSQAKKGVWRKVNKGLNRRIGRFIAANDDVSYASKRVSSKQVSAKRRKKSAASFLTKQFDKVKSASPALKQLGKKAPGVLKVGAGALELGAIYTDDSLSNDQKTQRASTAVGGMGGALAGAAAGAAIGSVVPVVGTAIGGIIGGILGGMAGESIGGAVGDALTEASSEQALNGQQLKALQAPPANDAQFSSLASERSNVVNFPHSLATDAYPLSRVQQLNQASIAANTLASSQAALTSPAKVTVNNAITINAAQGMNPQAIADAVRRELDVYERNKWRQQRFTYLDEVIG